MLVLGRHEFWHEGVCDERQERGNGDGGLRAEGEGWGLADERTLL